MIWLHSLIGLDGSVPIVSYVPLFMFAILFGLSMDYEVFLVSQIQEHVHEGEDNNQSVVKGLITSAEVITAAATIMVFVFGSFVLNGDPTVKQFGIGLAVAVILDATVVRCLLVPARMVALGKKSWYMPRWLDRVVPHINIEGAEFFDRRDRHAASRLEPERQPAVRSAGGGVDHAVGVHISAHPQRRTAASELPALDGSRDRAQAVQAAPPPGVHPGATGRGSRPVADPANRQPSGNLTTPISATRISLIGMPRVPTLLDARTVRPRATLERPHAALSRLGAQRQPGM
jgi:MMPL family